MSELDEKLVQSAKGGNVEAFDNLVSLHQERVHALAYRILGNLDDAADVQQETFVRAWQNLRKFRGEAQFSTWLHRIAVNLCLSMKRRRNPAADESFAEDRYVPHTAVACPEKTETIAVLRRVLAAMPAHHRILVVLRDMEGRSFEEIAGVLGCSAASARTRLCRARRLLRDRMRPYIEEVAE